MFSQPMGRGHAQFEFSQHEMREILIDINRANLKMSPSMVEFRAMLRAMLACGEPRTVAPTQYRVTATYASRDGHDAIVCDSEAAARELERSIYESDATGDVICVLIEPIEAGGA